MWSAFSGFWKAVTEAFIGVLVSVGVTGVVALPPISPALPIIPPTVELEHQKKPAEDMRGVENEVVEKAEVSIVKSPPVEIEEIKTDEVLQPSKASDLADSSMTVEEYTHVFAGDIMEKIGGDSASIAGAQFRVDVRNDWSGSSKGNVSGSVVVNFLNEERYVNAHTSGLHHVFYTKWNQQKGWYDVIRLSIYIID